MTETKRQEANEFIRRYAEDAVGAHEKAKAKMVKQVDGPYMVTSHEVESFLVAQQKGHLAAGLLAIMNGERLAKGDGVAAVTFMADDIRESLLKGYDEGRSSSASGNAEAESKRTAKRWFLDAFEQFAQYGDDEDASAREE